MNFRQLVLAIAALLVVAVSGCRSERMPEPDSEAYRETVTAFFTGAAALQIGQDRHAEEQFLLAADLAPDEPAVWGNLGLLALRRSELELAAERLARARSLAPDESRLHFLSGLVEVARGNADAAIGHFRRARELDPANLKAVYALGEQIEQRGDEGATAEVRALVDAILEIEPNNLAVLTERARRAALDGDVPTVREAIERLGQHASEWSVESREQLDEVRRAVQSENLDEAATQLSFLSNVLKRETTYRESLASIRSEPGAPGDMIGRFLALPNPSPQPAPPDDSLTFVMEPLFIDRGDRDWRWARAVTLSAEGLPVLVATGGGEIFFEDGTTLSAPPDLPAGGLIGIDYNYDFRVDLALAGPGGFQLHRQEQDSAFVDVTRSTGIPDGLLEAGYSGGWSVDVDMEGDLDLILARESGPPVVLRNRGDGTFEPRQLFTATSEVVDFTWADLDGDGDPDAAFVSSSGSVHFYENRRSQGFEHRLIGDVEDAAAVTISDLNADGALELLVLARSGIIRRMDLNREDASLSEVVRWEDPPSSAQLRLLAVDMDNNGAVDLLASGGGETAVWLSQPDGTFKRLAARTDLDTFTAADVAGGGRLDLIGVSRERGPVRFANRGFANYHSKSVRPLAATATGDQRINPFGIGGEIEVRSGLLYQKQPILDPVVHFGLGDQLVVDVARIVWPNGDIQAEFDLLSDETVQARQRLKGSCPWLFTYDGEGMRFVTDFIWRSPLGLRINAQETAGIMATEDWVKIGGGELRPRDGYYDVRITAELWETHFFDHVSLMVVDHPADTDVWIDERFAFPPPEFEIHATGAPRPVRSVLDDDGRDVTEFVAKQDGRYLATFDLGSYQGIAKEHTIVIDLSDAPASGPLYLLASGWVRPTDSSINVAVSQGAHEPPSGLRLDVPDGRGGWRTAYPNLGFPAGKHKTIVLDLTGIFGSGDASAGGALREASDGEAPGESADRRIRLTTNLEIYWDAISWAVGRPETELRTVRMDPAVAELRYRGYSVVSEPDRTHPEVPTYDSLMSTTQIWRDLEGYYTRFGDVRELLRRVDDRYVIMNAGDELAFRFDEVAAPPDGWVRDYVLIGDGWVKDGDYNTTYSETVRPLPAHDLPEYSRPRVALEKDAVYQRHPGDWQRFHTRYVAPEKAWAGLIPRTP